MNLKEVFPPESPIDAAPAIQAGIDEATAPGSPYTGVVLSAGTFELKSTIDVLPGSPSFVLRGADGGGGEASLPRATRLIWAGPPAEGVEDGTDRPQEGKVDPLAVLLWVGSRGVAVEDLEFAVRPGLRACAAVVVGNRPSSVRKLSQGQLRLSRCLFRGGLLVDPGAGSVSIGKDAVHSWRAHGWGASRLGYG